MSKQKRRKGEIYNDYLTRLKETNKSEISIVDLVNDKSRLRKIVGETYLSLNFSIMTDNSNYNFEALNTINDNKEKADFLMKLCHIIKAISQCKVKELGSGIFYDKIKLSSYADKAFYSNSRQELIPETETISINIGGQKGYRMICWKKNMDDSILYVLGFQFNFNKSPYKH